MAERFEEMSRAPAVRGFLSRPDKSHDKGLVLTHGAGANCDSLLLRAVGDAFAGIGYTVLRCDLAFRQQKRFGPPRGSGAQDREGLRNAVLALREMIAGPIHLGGHSYGGRMASMLAAEDPSICAGLLLLSYPLHPPEKPQQLRTAHFPNLRAPAFFVHGERDPFATTAELQLAMTSLRAVAGSFEVESAGHDLGFGRGAQRYAELPPTIANKFDTFMKIVFANPSRSELKMLLQQRL
jgi:predicted alpha/beta-hydrolase family hydrolase